MNQMKIWIEIMNIKINFIINSCNGIIHLSSLKYTSLLNLMLKIGKILKKAKLISSAKESDFKSDVLKPQYLGLKTNYKKYIDKVYTVGLKEKLKEYVYDFNKERDF